MTEHDPVNHPSHYTAGGVECIDGIEAALTSEGFISFCLGNSMKYIWRAGLKDDRTQDLRKAIWYVERAIKTIQVDASR